MQAIGDHCLYLEIRELCIMPVNSKLLGLFVEEIYAVGSFEDRFKIFEKYIKLLGFDGATYTLIPGLFNAKTHHISKVDLS